AGILPRTTTSSSRPCGEPTRAETCKRGRGSEPVNGLKRKIHFIGVGGIGMSGLAEILLNLGYDVSGSDLARSEITDRLVTYGLRFAEGHDAAHVGDAAVVVVSAAVPEDNAELQF